MPYAKYDEQMWDEMRCACNKLIGWPLLAGATWRVVNKQNPMS
jgi:hypothetical protein